MTNIKVLFAAFEATPFIKTGGLGDVAGSLPAALQQQGCQVRLILPKLLQIPEHYRSAMQLVARFDVPMGWRTQQCALFSLEENGVCCYFIENAFFFERDRAYGYGDDHERVALFSKAVLEALPYMPDFFPNIIHVHDWHTALLPVLLREHFRFAQGYDAIRTVFTIHNLRFQGICGDYVLGDLLSLHDCKNAFDQLRWPGDCINYMQGALYYSDYITTVSPSYAEEICTPEYGEGLDHVLRQRKDRLCGILNGIDTEKFSPANAPVPYSMQDMTGKAACKAQLQQELGLPQRADVPLIALISRLTSQKGMDLLAGALEGLAHQDLQFAVLGTGEACYEQLLGSFGERFRDKIAFRCTFDEPLSVRMYAAADFFLMPSMFEPCGLSQMISMRFGTLPIVRETGGLKDSVVPYNRFTGEGTGFGFIDARSEVLLRIVGDACRLYTEEPEAFRQLRRQAMARDWSWKASAASYLDIYERVLAN